VSASIGGKYAGLVTDIQEIGRRLYNKGLVAANDGNISVRLGEDRFLITASGVSKGFLTADDLVVIDGDGQVLEGEAKPSSEYRMHLGIYRERKDVHAVVHAHPPTATAFTVAGLSMMDPVLPEMVVFLGGVPTVPFAVPGTEDLSDKMRPFLAKHDALLLENHGAVTIGSQLFEAYYRMESVEMTAQIRCIARGLGEERKLSREQVRQLIASRAAFQLTGRHPGQDLLKPGIIEPTGDSKEPGEGSPEVLGLYLDYL
jgi:L-fuculose-phosphate aldolase